MASMITQKAAVLVLKKRNRHASVASRDQGLADWRSAETHAADEIDPMHVTH